MDFPTYPPGWHSKKKMETEEVRKYPLSNETHHSKIRKILMYRAIIDYYESRLENPPLQESVDYIKLWKDQMELLLQ